MNEFDLIQKLIPSLSKNAEMKVGAGDDCAVIDLPNSTHDLLFKTDAVVEGIHFESDAHPAKIGRKALARAVSDIAAMGGCPTQALITIALPEAWIKNVGELYSGINTLAQQFNIGIAGGETCRSPGPVFISISLLGNVAKGKAILRSGARAGDALFVTGDLGGSIAGRHFDFEPRVHEGLWLAEHFDIHAMIDLSDGLAGDLPHLISASRVGADLRAKSIPISRAAKSQTATSGKSALQHALSDGEDFELLFCLPSADAVRLLDSWKEKFPNLPLHCIGRITQGSQLRIQTEHGLHTLTEHGYAHFQKP